MHIHGVEEYSQILLSKANMGLAISLHKMRCYTTAYRAYRTVLYVLEEFAN